MQRMVQAYRKGRLLRYMNMRRSISTLLLLITLGSLSAQLSEEAKISVLTIRPGDEIYTIFGHTSLRVYDPTKGKDQVFNYGLFSFSEPNFTMKFLRGKLLYYLGLNRYKSFMDENAYEKRSTFEQVLDLDMVQKNKLYAAMLENVKPKNRRYLYDFFYDNCSTRLRDQFLKNIDGIAYPKTSLGDLTYRQLLDQYTYRTPWTDFGMDLLVGARADKKAGILGEMYLPLFFYNHLSKTTLNGKPLVSEDKLVLDFEAEERLRDTVPFFSPALLFGFLLFFEILLFIRSFKSRNAVVVTPRWLSAYDRLWYFILSICGVVLLLMWFGTDHFATKWNFNVLWMSPLFLWKFFAPRSTRADLTISISLIFAFIAAAFLQQFHVASIIIAILLLFKLLRSYRLSFSKKTANLA